MAKVRRSVRNYTLTLQMFSINILRFMSNFSFNGDTLYRAIPSGGIDLFIPRIVLWGDTISRDTRHAYIIACMSVWWQWMFFLSLENTLLLLLLVILMLV